MGLTFPGCPATYQQQFQQFLPEGQSQSQKFRDEHQKIHQFRQGDIVACRGVAHWFYNEAMHGCCSICLRLKQQR